VLQHLSQNNLCLSAAKTVICPTETTIFGWKWKNGTLSPCIHKTSLASVKSPVTCTAMRSFIRAFKALARCIPRYSPLVAPLEDFIKGMQGQQKIKWTENLKIQFSRCQQAVNSPTTITISRPNDKLILTVARGTCYLIRCRNFAPFIRDSHHSIQVLTDNESCVDAYQKIRQGKFSTSSRVSTFLTTLSKFNVEVCHIKGSSNLSSDYSSRNPNVCSDKSCLQVCTANCRFCRPTSVNSFGIRPNAILEQLFLAHRTPGLPFFTTHLRTPAAGDTPCEKNEACNI